MPAATTNSIPHDTLIPMKEDQTHFGYEQVKTEEKASRVREVFSSVASKYDVMNDLMSLGTHRLWKRRAIQLLNLQPNHHVLDLAGGTGDLSALIYPKVRNEGRLVLSDINPDMLLQGRARLTDQGMMPGIECTIANAEALPFAEYSFDRIIIGFGLRNVTDKAKALRAMLSCLKPGGMALVLEFSKPTHSALGKVYDWYSFNLLPKLGGWIAQDEDSYRYLAESIRMHPDQQGMLHLMEDAGFARVDYQNLAGGIVAIHRGYRL